MSGVATVGKEKKDLLSFFGGLNYSQIKKSFDLDKNNIFAL